MFLQNPENLNQTTESYTYMDSFFQNQQFPVLLNMPTNWLTSIFAMIFANCILEIAEKWCYFYICNSIYIKNVFSKFNICISESYGWS